MRVLFNTCGEGASRCIGIGVQAWGDGRLVRQTLIPVRLTTRLGGLLPAAFALLIVVLGTPAAGAQPTASAPGKPAPDFTLRTLAGPNVRLSDFRGDVVLLSFWTSWCGSCKAHLERVARFYATYQPAGLVVIGVGLDDDRAKALAFATANGGKVPQGFDADKSVARAYGINDVPLTILVDRNGVVRYVHGEFSRRDEGDLVDQIRQLLDE